MIEIREYIDAKDHSPFQKWFDRLDDTAAAKVTIALTKLEQGHLGNVKGVGAGVSEYKIDYGPGYRMYFGRDGKTLIILLTGGSKKQQQKAIEQAKAYWQDYKQRKKAGEQ